MRLVSRSASGRITPGSVIDTPLWSPDLLQAAVAISGASLPEEGIAFDGHNPLEVLTGETKDSPHQSFFFQYQKHAALRWGDWKIVREKPDQAWQLFNLSSDLGETKDRSADEAERVEALSAEFERWRRQF